MNIKIEVEDGERTHTVDVRAVEEGGSIAFKSISWLGLEPQDMADALVTIAARFVELNNSD